MSQFSFSFPISILIVFLIFAVSSGVGRDRNEDEKEHLYVSLCGYSLGPEGSINVSKVIPYFTDH